VEASRAVWHQPEQREAAEEDELAFADEFESMTIAAAMRPGDSLLSALARVADMDLHLLVSNPLWDAMELVNLTWGRTSFQEQLAHGYVTLDARPARSTVQS